MPLFRRLLPLLSTIILGVLLEWIIFRPTVIWVLGGLLIVITAATTVIISHSDTRGGRWHFSVLAAIFSFSVVVFLLLLQTSLLKQFHIGGALALWWLWSEQLYRFGYSPQQYIPFSVANVTSVATVLTSFYIISSAFALKLLLGYPTWFLTIIIGFMGFLFTIEVIWSEKLSPKRYWLLPLSVSIIAAELFWALHYLPSSYLVNGLLLTVILYVAVNMGRFSLKRELTTPMIRRYLLIGLFVIVLTVVSARWV
jgi:hypothetical protein